MLSHKKPLRLIYKCRLNCRLFNVYGIINIQKKENLHLLEFVFIYHLVIYKWSNHERQATS